MSNDTFPPVRRGATRVTITDGRPTGTGPSKVLIVPEDWETLLTRICGKLGLSHVGQISSISNQEGAQVEEIEEIFSGDRLTIHVDVPPSNPSPTQVLASPISSVHDSPPVLQANSQAGRAAVGHSTIGHGRSRRSHSQGNAPDRHGPGRESLSTIPSTTVLSSASSQATSNARGAFLPRGSRLPFMYEESFNTVPQYHPSGSGEHHLEDERMHDMVASVLDGDDNVDTHTTNHSTTTVVTQPMSDTTDPLARSFPPIGSSARTNERSSAPTSRATSQASLLNPHGATGGTNLWQQQQHQPMQQTSVMAPFGQPADNGHDGNGIGVAGTGTIGSATGTTPQPQPYTHHPALIQPGPHLPGALNIQSFLAEVNGDGNGDGAEESFNTRDTFESGVSSFNSAAPPPPPQLQHIQGTQPPLPVGSYPVPILNTREQGVIADLKRNYGFIQPYGREEQVFFHIGQLLNETTVRAGDLTEYTIVVNPATNKLMGIDVVIISRAVPRHRNPAAAGFAFLRRPRPRPGTVDERDFIELGYLQEQGYPRFIPLISILQQHRRSSGMAEMEMARVGGKLASIMPNWKQELNIERLKDYITQAKAAGLVTVRHVGLQHYVAVDRSPSGLFSPLQSLQSPSLGKSISPHTSFNSKDHPSGARGGSHAPLGKPYIHGSQGGREIGVVKFIKESYGFVVSQGHEEDLFYHSRSVEGGVTLQEGDVVEFSVAINSKTGKPNAVRVTLTERPRPGTQTIPSRGRQSSVSSGHDLHAASSVSGIGVVNQRGVSDAGSTAGGVDDAHTMTTSTVASEPGSTGNSSVAGHMPPPQSQGGQSATSDRSSTTRTDASNNHDSGLGDNGTGASTAQLDNWIPKDVDISLGSVISTKEQLHAQVEHFLSLCRLARAQPLPAECSLELIRTMFDRIQIPHTHVVLALVLGAGQPELPREDVQTAASAVARLCALSGSLFNITDLQSGLQQAMQLYISSVDAEPAAGSDGEKKTAALKVAMMTFTGCGLGCNCFGFRFVYSLYRPAIERDIAVELVCGAVHEVSAMLGSNAIGALFHTSGLRLREFARHPEAEGTSSIQRLAAEHQLPFLPESVL